MGTGKGPVEGWYTYIGSYTLCGYPPGVQSPPFRSSEVRSEDRFAIIFGCAAYTLGPLRVKNGLPDPRAQTVGVKVE